MNWLKTQIEWIMIQDPGSLLVAALGWPAVLLGLSLSVAGVVFKNSRLLIIAAVLILPLSIYLLGGNNWISRIFPIFPILLVICWYTVRRNLYLASWLILVVPITGFSYLAYLVINQ